MIVLWSGEMDNARFVPSVTLKVWVGPFFPIESDAGAAPCTTITATNTTNSTIAPLSATDSWRSFKPVIADVRIASHFLLKKGSARSDEREIASNRRIRFRECNESMFSDLGVEILSG
jgi:hypothetical protein